MCGRFSLTAPERLVAAFPRFRLTKLTEPRGPRFNIAPTQPVLAVRNGTDEIEELQWGIHGRINVRSEGVAARNRPVARRCAVFADGFYEWRGRTPVRYTLRTGEPFVLAGLWEPNRDAPAQCALLTCEPNELVRAVHDRMPVIVPPDALSLWLSPDALPPDVARAIMRPFDAAAMTARDASMRLNNARNEGPDVLRDDDPVQQSLGLGL